MSYQLQAMNSHHKTSLRVAGTFLLLNTTIFLTTVYLLDEVKYFFVMTYCLSWVYLVWAEQRDNWFKIPLALVFHLSFPGFVWIPMYFLQNIPDGFPLFLLLCAVVGFLVIVCMRLIGRYSAVILGLLLGCITAALYYLDAANICYVFAYLVLMGLAPVVNAGQFKSNIENVHKAD